MSELLATIAKLKALNTTVIEALNGGNYYDPAVYLELFDRYAPLRDSLRSQDPALFDDVPVREKPKPSNTTDFEGRGYISKHHIEHLWLDIQYCLEVFANFPVVEVPTVTITKAGIFFAGQYFDALQKVVEILNQAHTSIVIIDGYIDGNVLNLLTTKGKGVEVKILTKEVSSAVQTVANAFKQQYGGLQIRTSQAFHDRFVIIDDNDYYHFGASIKNLGNRGFMFSKIEEPTIIKALSAQWTQEWQNAKGILQEYTL
jgi:hypothetical protein